jgi:hypothetical protein
MATVAPGSTFTVSLDYTLYVIPDCPACIIELQVGYSHLKPQECVFTGFAPRNSSASATFTAPDKPGTYYIDISYMLEYYCLPDWKWSKNHIAAICVK